MDGQTSILVRQRLDPCDCLACFERRNKYRVAQTPDDWSGGGWNDKKFYAAPQIMTAKEESTCFQRYCCGPCRELNLHFTAGEQAYDKGGHELFTMHRPCKIPIICCCFWEFCSPEITTMNKAGDAVGRAVHDYRCMDKCCGKNHWRVEDHTQQALYYVQDDICCNANCCAPTFCCKVRKFKILDAQQTQEVGYIENIFFCNCKRLCFPGADQYRLNFPADATAEQKALLISALMLIEYTMFEHQDDQNIN